MATVFQYANITHFALRPDSCAASSARLLSEPSIRESASRDSGLRSRHAWRNSAWNFTCALWITAQAATGGATSITPGISSSVRSGRSSGSSPASAVAGAGRPIVSMRIGMMTAEKAPSSILAAAC